MKKSTLIALMAATAMTAAAQTPASFMDEATLSYPTGLFVSMVPSSVTVTWDNQPIFLIDPHQNDWEEDVVTAYVKLGDGEEQPVDAAILSSLGTPDDPGDLWSLDLALYDLDDLWDFAGDEVTVILPEGIVRNNDGAVNPAQQFVFSIVPTYLDYTIDPASGSALKEDLTVKISFGGNKIEYLQGSVSAMTYEPSYKEEKLALGQGVTITEDNEIALDLSCLPTGYYEIVVPEGFVLVAGEDGKSISPDIWLEYDIENQGGTDGVAAPAADNGEETLYNLQGIKVVKAGAKGLYISNGKKVVIR